MNEQKILWLNNPFDLSDVTEYSVDPDQTINEWLDNHGGFRRLNRMPTICVYDGKELMRSEYDQVIDQPVCFVTSLPTGGDSGSNPFAAVAMLALAVTVPGAVAAMGKWAVSTSALGHGLSFYGAVVTAGIMMGGAMFINAIFPPPDQPTRNVPSKGSPTYSAQAQGNMARLGGPIPVNYGRMRIFPDFAARPYTEYEGNEQFLYQLFCIGQGHNRVTDIRLAKTPIKNFSEVTVEIVPPMGKVTLFHTAVVTAPEAGGQDLTDPVSHGPFILNKSNTKISRVACDVIFPAGLIGVEKKKGDEYGVSVHLRVWVEEIDDQGKATGKGATVFDDTIHRRTRTAVRLTLAKDVPPGRYRMSIRRTTPRAPSHEIKRCQLVNMKGYLVDNNEYGDITLLAMRMRVTANISDASSRMVNVLNEGLIPVWNPKTGWSKPVITRNPAWAFADVARARYGGDYPDNEIDLNGLHYLAGLFDSRGDCFDGRFDTSQSLWDGLGKVGQVCRCGPVRQGNLVRMILDQKIETPSQLFGMANMTDFSIDFVMHDDRTADSVKITYWDEARDYAETTVLCQLPDGSKERPKEITLFGCTNYKQAWREGMYLAASNRERRQMVSWKTGMEGHIPTFGDLVLINHDLLSADQQFGGTIAAVDGNNLTLSRDVALTKEDSWYTLIRDRYGGPSKPLRTEQIDSHRIRILDTLPDIETDPLREPTHFVIGKGKQHSYPVKVTAITPEDIDSVTIAGCIESDLVHKADQGKMPPPPPTPKPPQPGLEVKDLRSTQGGTIRRPVIMLSWAVASGADRYQIEYRAKNSRTWQPAGAGESLINQHSFTCSPGLIVCRVAALAAMRGPWAMLDVNAGGSFDTPKKVVPVLVEPFVGESLKVRWPEEPAAARYLVEVWSKGVRCRGEYVERSVTEYEYFYTDAREDTASRTLTIKVRAQNAEGVDGPWGSVTASNPIPAKPVNVEVSGMLTSLMVKCSHNKEPDILELRVYGENKKGFKPKPENLLGRSPNSLITIPVEPDSEWYVRVAWVDLWGAEQLNYSDEHYTKVDKITETVIGKDSISTPLLKAGAVTAEKIKAGSITGKEISSETTITAGTGKNTAGMSGDSEKTRFWSGSDVDDAVDKAKFHVSPEGVLKARSAQFIEGNFSGDIYAKGDIVSGSRISGSAIEGSTIKAQSRVQGAFIDGGVVIGAKIYRSKEYLLADPKGDGTHFFYDNHPDVPLACEDQVLINKKDITSRQPDHTTRYYDIEVVPAALKRGKVTVNRARWQKVLSGCIQFAFSSYGNKGREVQVQLVDNDSGKLLAQSPNFVMVDQRGHRATVAGVNWYVYAHGFGDTGANVTGGHFGSLTNTTFNGKWRIKVRPHNTTVHNIRTYVFFDNKVRP